MENSKLQTLVFRELQIESKLLEYTRIGMPKNSKAFSNMLRELELIRANLVSL